MKAWNIYVRGLVTYSDQNLTPKARQSQLSTVFHNRTPLAIYSLSDPAMIRYSKDATTPSAVVYASLLRLAEEVVRNGHVSTTLDPKTRLITWQAFPDPEERTRLEKLLELAYSVGIFSHQHTVASPADALRFGVLWLNAIVASLIDQEAPVLSDKYSKVATHVHSRAAAARYATGMQLAIQVCESANGEILLSPVLASCPLHEKSRPTLLPLGSTISGKVLRNLALQTGSTASSLEDLLVTELARFSYIWKACPLVNWMIKPPRTLTEVSSVIANAKDIPILQEMALDQAEFDEFMRSTHRSALARVGFNLLTPKGTLVDTGLTITPRSKRRDALTVKTPLSLSTALRHEALPSPILITEDLGPLNTSPSCEFYLSPHDRKAVEVITGYSGGSLGPLLFSSQMREVDFSYLLSDIHYETPPPLPEPSGFVGKLRAYQSQGLAFLTALVDAHTGGVLCDDMGLGKTVQVIATLLARPRRTGLTSLVLCPPTLLQNWEGELKKFAPSLKVNLYHGKAKLLDLTADLVLTSYSTYMADPTLKDTMFSLVFLDEAQVLSNPQTKLHKTLQGLKASSIFALTGNDLLRSPGDLHAVMSITNPELFGPRSELLEALASRKSALRLEVARVNLRHLITPYFLRRTKSDPGVLDDLPPLFSQQVYSSLTSSQEMAYRQVVDNLKLELRKGNENRALLISQTLARLKRVNTVVDIPNTPALKTSGKLQRLAQLVSEIASEGHSVLIYTQFPTLVPIVTELLKTFNGLNVSAITSQQSLTARSNVVQSFNASTSGSALISTYKVAGTGLNLTKASHVILLDLPDKEDVAMQAIARSHRLGQLKSVQVHSFLAMGTFETDLVESENPILHLDTSEYYSLTDSQLLTRLSLRKI